MKSSN